MNNREEFLKRILATFKTEAEEGIIKIASNLAEMEKQPPAPRIMELVEASFRETHSLKGASRSVNNFEIESVCQALEGVFSVVKNKGLKLTPDIISTLHSAVETLEELLVIPAMEIGPVLSQKVTDITLTLNNIEQAYNTESGHSMALPANPAARTEKKSASTQTIRISAPDLVEMIFMVEELLSVKLSASQYTAEVYAIISKLETWRNEISAAHTLARNVRRKLENKQKESPLLKEEKDIKRLTDFIEETTSFWKKTRTDLINLRKFSMNENHGNALKIDTLMEQIKAIISVPFSTLLDVFPRTTRELAKDTGKMVDLQIIGDDTEIDRRILEEIRTPLMHLLRNCIDHGIEKPQLRKENHKPEKGKITFTVMRHEDNRVEITVADDGGGIDLVKMKAAYFKNNGIPADETAHIDDQTLYDYIFRSGISTSEVITDLSGRGLGLAIVNEKVDQLGGTITVTSKPGLGTEFIIRLPLSLETFRCVRVGVGDQQFVIPTFRIERVLRPAREDVKTVENKAVITYEKERIPLVFLSDILQIPNNENSSATLLVLVLGQKEGKMGFVVDDMLDEEEVLVKRFNKHITKVRNISGATVLGSGRVVPILNVSDLLKSALNHVNPVIRSENPMKEKIHILVVEDSITSRMLLKNILETAGYEVTTAVDGMDGFTRLKKGSFKVVVSDVDMPRMDGFELTMKIRSDNELGRIPVILVTALARQEDRERGIEVGADAYIVKSNFDQSNLLEVVERLC